MKAIEQTTLSIQDIKEHANFIKQEHCIDLFLPADRRQEVMDDMLERFCNEFID